MKILGTLHELRCTSEECYCDRLMLVVDALPTRATSVMRNGYNERDAISERDQHFARRTEYNLTGPAVPADPRSGPGLFIRGSGE